MKLQDAWSNIEMQKSGVSEGELKKSLSKKPQYLMDKIRSRLGWRIVFIIIFMPLYLFMILAVQHWLPVALLSFILLSHLLGLVFMLRRYRQIKKFTLSNGNVLGTLENYLANIRKTLRIEEISGLILYPVAASAGYFFSLLMSTPWQQVKSEPAVWWVLVLVLIIITPLSHWLARWMNKVSFGKSIAILEQRLHELKASEA